MRRVLENFGEGSIGGRSFLSSSQEVKDSQLQHLSSADKSSKPFEEFNRYKLKANTANKMPYFAELFYNPVIYAD
jgi:hypothetical protein